MFFVYLTVNYRIKEGMMSDKKGLFITFEGIDGSGKSTQIDFVEDYLRENAISYIRTRDPGGTPLGEHLRKILLNYEGKIYSTCELFLYLADRAQHVEEKIIPALESGKVVLCDRYIDSTVAYQGFARGIDVKSIFDLNLVATKSLMPDITLIYDLPVEAALSRLGKEKDRLESEHSDFHEKVRNGYLNLANLYPNRIKVIDANREINSISLETINTLKNII